MGRSGGGGSTRGPISRPHGNGFRSQGPQQPLLPAHGPPVDDAANDAEDDPFQVKERDRGEMARKYRPLALQWGGAQLFKDGFKSMPDKRARFLLVNIPRIDVPAGKFYFTTRRGKQFNSMTYGEADPLTGSQHRDDIFMHPADAARLEVTEGEAVIVWSPCGELRGRVRLADIHEGNLQAHWPEGNVLIERRYDPVSAEPDYNALVEVIKAEVRKGLGSAELKNAGGASEDASSSSAPAGVSCPDARSTHRASDSL